MRRTILIGAAVAAAAALGATAATAKPEVVPVSTYLDETGDSGTAPDLTQVVVTDRGDGTLRFEITLGSVADLAGSTVVAFLDTDRDPATGNHGADYAVAADETGAGFAHWGEQGWEDAAHAALEQTLENGVFGFTLAAADVGVAPGAGFGLQVGSWPNEPSNADFDSLPDGGTWLAYPARPVIERLLIPATVLLPKAGTVLRARAIQVLLADGSPQAEITMTCRLARQGKALPALNGGCAWKLPKALAGRKLTLAVTFSSGDVVLMQRTLPVSVR